MTVFGNERSTPHRQSTPATEVFTENAVRLGLKVLGAAAFFCALFWLTMLFDAPLSRSDWAAIVAALLIFWVWIESLRARWILADIRDDVRRAWWGTHSDGQQQQKSATEETLTALYAEVAGTNALIQQSNLLAEKHIKILLEESARLQPQPERVPAKPPIDVMEALKRSLAAKRTSSPTSGAEGRPQKPVFGEAGFEQETFEEFEVRLDCYMELLIEFKAREMLSTAFGISF